MKDQIIILRVSADEKERWEDCAIRAGISLSEWIRLKCTVVYTKETVGVDTSQHREPLTKELQAKGKLHTV